MVSGFINVYKPKNMTSAQVVSIVKKITNAKKVGHFGTLDPLATGVLPIAINNATKLFDYFLNKDKKYIAVFRFSETTDTLDQGGKIIKTNCKIPTEKNVRDVLSIFIKQYMQTPPLYSAKNVDGQRAYALARKGKDFSLKAKKVSIYDINYIEKIDELSHKLLIHCSSGTYIRSLARDIAYELNTCGFMSELERVESGYFNKKNAITLDYLKEHGFEDNLINIIDVLGDLNKREIDKKYYDKIINGVKIKIDIEDIDNFLLYCDNKLIGISESKDNVVKVKIRL